MIKEPGLEPRYRVALESVTSSFCPVLLRKDVEHTRGSQVSGGRVQKLVAA